MFVLLYIADSFNGFILYRFVSLLWGMVTIPFFYKKLITNEMDLYRANDCEHLGDM